MESLEVFLNLLQANEQYLTLIEFISLGYIFSLCVANLHCFCVNVFFCTSITNSAFYIYLINFVLLACVG